MIIPQISYNIDRLRESLIRYAQASGKTEAEVVSYWSRKLAYNIRDGLSAIAPEKGSIRSERLAALRGGGGIRIRQSVLMAIATKYHAVTQVATHRMFLESHRGRKTVSLGREVIDPKTGKPLNLEALAAQREINLRESGRRFLAISTPIPGMEDPAETTVSSRYGFRLSTFNLSIGEHASVKKAELRWLGSGTGEHESPVEGLLKERQMEIMKTAIDKVRAKINTYVQEKLDAAAKSSGLK